MPKRTNLKDNTYYWVRQHIRREDNGKSRHPHWEPMLHDKGRFYQAGLPDNHPGFAPSALDAIGEPIIRRGPRTVRKGWMPTSIHSTKGCAMPDPYNLADSRNNRASLPGNGLAVPVEISWENADFNFANGYAKARVKELRKKATAP